MRKFIIFPLSCICLLVSGQAVNSDSCQKHNPVKCNKNIEWPQRQKGNTFYGCWQAIIDGNYTELFFTNDSVYAYDKNGRDKKVLHYSLTDSIFEFNDSDGEQIFCTYTIENVASIKFNCSFNFIWGRDTTTYNPVFKTQRIEYQEYTYDEVQCWGEYDESSGGFIQSEDAVKYHKAFMDRMIRFMPK